MCPDLIFSSIVLSLRVSCSLQEKADLVLEIEMGVMEPLRILPVISLEKKRIVSWGNKREISRLRCTETPERQQGDFLIPFVQWRRHLVTAGKKFPPSGRSNLNSNGPDPSQGEGRGQTAEGCPQNSLIEIHGLLAACKALPPQLHGITPRISLAPDPFASLELPQQWLWPRPLGYPDTLTNLKIK